MSQVINPDPTLRSLQERDRICDRYEAALRKGDAPRIDDFLAEVAEPDRPALFRELLAVELAWASPAHSPRRQQLRDRYPALAAIIDEVFDDASTRFSPPPPDEGTVSEATGDAPDPGPREPYRKIRKIGSGGLGVVYLAHDEELDRKVAVKEVRPDLVHDPNIRKRFEYEARVNAALEHPGIVPVHAAAIDGTDGPYFVTRFIEGRSLSQEIAELHREAFWGRRLAGERQLALQRLLRRFVVVCETVAYAHSRGVVHRDLKPAHILFGPFGETMVIDWGLAKPIDGGADAETTHSTRSRPLPAWDRGELTITGDEVGTPLYASPEQARGEHDRVGPASDTFSLGSILYQVLTGWPPFRRNPPGGHACDPVAAVAFLRPRAIHPGIPRGLEAICLKAMEREPETRYPSPLALAEDLERWLAGEPVSVHRESAAARLLRWSRRRRITSGVLVGVLATSLLALVFLLGQSNLSRSRVARPVDLIEAARPEEVPGLADMLHQDAPAALAVIHERLDAARTPESRLALGLAALHLSDEEAPALEGLLRDEPAARARLAAALVGEAGVPLRNLLRPVGPALVDELLKAESSAFDYRDREPWTSARRALAEYAEGRPDALARCLAYAEEGEYEDLLAKLGRCDPAAARGELRQMLLRLSAMPRRPEPDLAWAAPPADALAAIAAAGGVVRESFLVAQTLDLARFRSLARQLVPSGFRPARFRPYRSEDGRLMVTAVWHRDGASFAFEEGLSAEAIVEADRRHAETLIPVDVSVYPSERGEAVYAAVWAEPDRPYRVLRDDLTVGFFPKLDALSRRRHPSRRIVAGLGLDVARSQDENRNSENWSTLCIQVLRTADGRRPMIQIRDNRSLVGPSFALECSTREALADLQAHGLLQSDVCVDPCAGGGASPLFVSTWVEPRTGESVMALAAGRGEHLLEMTRLADLGYSPVSVSLREGPGGPLATSVWARPRWNFRNVQPSDLAARIAVGLLRLGDEAPAWELLRLQADPTTRAFLMEAMPRLGVPIETLAERLEAEPNVSARRAILLSLGSYGSPCRPQTLVRAVASLAWDDPDSGLHSASLWLLRRWSLDDELAAVRRSLPRGNSPARPGDRWFVNAEGQSFAVVPGPVSFVMGEPMWSSDGERFALPHRVRIERDFAIAAAEVTAAEFDRFRIDLATQGITIPWKPRTQFVRDPDGPALAVDFYLAARYCNWLSERAGIPRDQWCFVEKDGTLDLAPDYLQRTGYRLPTEAEWEFACRAGTETPWPIGRGWGGQVPFIDQYSWCLTGYSRNQSRPVGLLKPNDLGLFDMLGNAHEWCLDPKEDYCRGTCHRERSDREHPERLSREGKRILRGGWFNFPAEGVSSGHRSWGRALDDDNEIGLRLARTLPRPAVASRP